jgi:FMN-dependent NADH-azoreductase
MTTIVIHNTETNEIIERDMTSEELTQHEKDLANAKAEQIKKQEKADAKAAAEAKLTALGLTADDLKALGL